MTCSIHCVSMPTSNLAMLQEECFIMETLQYTGDYHSVWNHYDWCDGVRWEGAIVLATAKLWTGDKPVSHYDDVTGIEFYVLHYRRATLFIFRL